jgi:ABC-2 type transport system permease protein
VQTLTKTTWVELKLFAREPLTVVFTFALPLMLLFILGSAFGNQPDPEVYRGFGAMDYYVPAYIALVLAAVGLIALPVHLASYRERGVLRRLRASAIPMWGVFGAQVAVTIIVGILSSLLLVVVAGATYTIASPHSLLGVIAAFALGALTFGALGLFLGLVLPSARAAQGAGVLLWFGMLLIGGGGPPFELLPAALVSVGDATPLKHVVVLLQDPWLGLGWNASQMLIVGGFLAVPAILTLIVSRRG